MVIVAATDPDLQRIQSLSESSVFTEMPQRLKEWLLHFIYDCFVFHNTGLGFCYKHAHGNTGTRSVQLRGCAVSLKAVNEAKSSQVIYSDGELSRLRFTQMGRYRG